MNADNFITVLVAEDNDVSREMMTGILRAQGYRVFGAIDGESAIKVINERPVDIALVDINMAPKGGFEFARYVLAAGLKIPIVVITGDDSVDLLVEANALDIAKVIQKPLDPQRLLMTVDRILRRRGLNPAPMAVTGQDTAFDPVALMKKVLDMAVDNALSKKGGPYAALVADGQGRILGSGLSGLASRVDPTAHAEVMAIRQAAEKIGKTDLSPYVLYCSSYPTQVGQAVIQSVGLTKVYYALAPGDGRLMGQSHGSGVSATYVQSEKETALAVFSAAGLIKS